MTVCGGAAHLARLTVTPPPASMSWTPSALPATEAPDPGVDLQAVSCTTQGACEAVGSYLDGADSTQGLVVSKPVGGVATAGKIAPPPGAAGAVVTLGAISCPSAGNCSAVGGYHDSAGNSQGLLLTESTGKWTSAGPTLPANASTKPAVVVSAVSCASAGNCSAVGDYTDAKNHRQGLLVSENSGTWGPGRELLFPPGAANGTIEMVSLACVSAGNCTAIGTFADSSSRQGLLVGERSGVWSVMEAPLPAGAAADPEVFLSSVSCPSVGGCAAAGYYLDNSGHQQGLLLSESSGVWAGAELAVPAVATITSVFLQSVSCGSAGNCGVAGFYMNSSGGSRGLVATEVSGVWAPATEIDSPVDAGNPPDDALGSISCPAPGDCTAVGNYADSAGGADALFVSESAGSWGTANAAALPAGAAASGYALVSSISCWSPGDCAAAGAYSDTFGDRIGLLDAQQNGSFASAVRVPLPGDAGVSATAGLVSVSCPAPGACAAVGEESNGIGTVPMLASQNGGTWTSTSVGLPAGSADIPTAHFEAVTCVSPGNCDAVGAYDDSSGNEQGLVVDETSGTWEPATEVVLPADAGTNPRVVLAALSCPSAGNCTAVGSYVDVSGGEQGLILEESDGSWDAGRSAPLPPGAGGNPRAIPTSLSCPSVGSCTAVGTYEDSGNNRQGLLLDEVSGTWTAVEATTPPAYYDPSTEITSVSCAAPGYCSAVGSYVTMQLVKEGLLLSETNGTWSAGEQVVPPSNAYYQPNVSMASVSCARFDACTAVGSYVDSSGHGAQGMVLTESSGSWGNGSEVVLPASSPGSTTLVLNSLSCPEASACAASGTYYTPTGLQELVVTESAGTWADGLVTLLPSDSASPPEVNTYSISCASAGHCATAGSYFVGSHSDGLVEVLATPTAISTRSSADPAPIGHKVTYAAAVVPLPTGGTVDFNDDGTPIPGCSAVAVSTTTGGATCSTSYATPGGHEIVAAFSGDGYSGPSTAVPLTETIIKASTTSVITLTPSSVTAGSEVTFTMRVRSPFGTPSGRASFRVGAVELCAASLTSGVASCRSNAAPAGNDRVSGTYSGDGTHAGSTSTALLKVAAHLLILSVRGVSGPASS
jgi:hypothetical protein